VAVLASGCARRVEISRAEEPHGGRLLVTNEVGGDISVIDVSSKTVVATIPVGKRPRGIKLSPDGSTLFVALSGSPMAPPGVDESTLPPPDSAADGIGVVSVAEMRLLRVIPGGSDPEQTAVSADGARLFVANEDAGEVSVVAVADGRLLATLPAGGEPEGVDLSPDGDVVYVTSEEDGVVAVLDARRLQVLTRIPVGERPRSTAFLPDGSRAYVTAENGASVAVVDARAHRVLRTIQLSGPLVRPMGAVASPDGTRVFVTTGRGKNVVVIDVATDEAIAAIEVGERPWGIAVSADGKTVFTANGPSNDVSFVDVERRAVVARVNVGDRPWGIAYVRLWQVDRAQACDEGNTYFVTGDGTFTTSGGGRDYELYNGDLAGTEDTLGIALKFCVPLVADGRVYVGGRSEFAVYGLLP
jgi:YVTN family beta-propeller protein